MRSFSAPENREILSWVIVNKHSNFFLRQLDGSSGCNHPDHQGPSQHVHCEARREMKIPRRDRTSRSSEYGHPLRTSRESKCSKLQSLFQDARTYQAYPYGTLRLSSKINFFASGLFGSLPTNSYFLLGSQINHWIIKQVEVGGFLWKSPSSYENWFTCYQDPCSRHVGNEIFEKSQGNKSISQRSCCSHDDHHFGSFRKGQSTCWETCVHLGERVSKWKSVQQNPGIFHVHMKDESESIDLFLRCSQCGWPKKQVRCVRKVNGSSLSKSSCMSRRANPGNIQKPKDLRFNCQLGDIDCINSLSLCTWYDEKLSFTIFKHWGKWNQYFNHHRLFTFGPVRTVLLLSIPSYHRNNRSYRPKPRSQARSMTIRIDARSTMRNWKTSSRWGNTIYLCNFHSKDTTALSVTWTIFQSGFEKNISAFNSKSRGASFLGFVRLLPRGSHTRHPHLGE